jgi:hypothetical protein
VSRLFIARLIRSLFLIVFFDVFDCPFAFRLSIIVLLLSDYLAYRHRVDKLVKKLK